MAELTPGQIKTALPEVKDWQKQSVSITRTFQFKDFGASIEFVNKVARVAEEANHHPDIDIRYRTVHLSLATHDAGHKVTAKDFTLAEKINELKDADLDLSSNEFRRRLKA